MSCQARGWLMSASHETPNFDAHAELVAPDLLLH